MISSEMTWDYDLNIDKLFNSFSRISFRLLFCVIIVRKDNQNDCYRLLQWNWHLLYISNKMILTLSFKTWCECDWNLWFDIFLHIFVQMFALLLRGKQINFCPKLKTFNTLISIIFEKITFWFINRCIW